MGELKRFIALGDTKELEKLIKRKALNHEDLMLIFKSLDVNRTVYPEIEERRRAVHKI